nr:unnamed protein product [Callosobruchus chinensis]
MFRCHICSRPFHQKSSFKRHLLSLHNWRFQDLRLQRLKSVKACALRMSEREDVPMRNMLQVVPPEIFFEEALQYTSRSHFDVKPVEERTEEREICLDMFFIYNIL